MSDASDSPKRTRLLKGNLDMPTQNERIYNYTVVETAAGWVPIAGRDGKVSAIEMPQATRDQAIATLGAGIDGELVESNDGFGSFVGQIRDYFAGKRTEFTFEPDLEDLTEFQRKVLRTTMTVPYGSVVSYRWIAERAGHPGAFRAAGQALGRNPMPVAIPCHRVVASGGRLGGFSGGLHWKEKMLAMEGIEL
jgi:methylated-DNA-[protein]-cysteine S-methyltransferase